MKKFLATIAVCIFASAVFAADKAAPHAKTAKAAAKPTVEFIVVESAKYDAGKQDERATAALAEFLEVTPKVTAMTYEAAKQDPKLASFDYSFLPLYLVKKTPAVRKKLEQHIAAGYVKEQGDYLQFAHVTRTGVYAEKKPQPGVLELFVMSQCPYGVMAEGLVIAAQKEGKIPADKTIKVRYIVNYNEQAKSFQSLHGPAEWEEDVRQLLIAKYYPTKLWKYLEIRNKNYQSSRWDKAMEEAGINVSKIMKKFDTEGVELLKQEAAYSDQYEVNASPTFLWEGKEVLDFGAVSRKPGLEFLNPSKASRNNAPVPTGSC